MRRTLIGITAAAVLTVAGCASTPSPTAATPPTTTGDVVTVTMTDFKLALNPSTIGPGPHTFHAVNAGRAPHSIEVDGPGVADQRISGVVAPGQSADLTVTLQSGTYDMYCPVGNHRAMGMEVTFVVGGTATDSSGAGSSGTGY